MPFKKFNAALSFLPYRFSIKRTGQIMAIFLLAVFCLAGNLNAALWQDDFEVTGAWDDVWIQGSGSATQSSEQAVSGSYSARFRDTCSYGGAGFGKNLGEPHQWNYMRFELYIDPSFSLSNGQKVAIVEGGEGYIWVFRVYIYDDLSLSLWNEHNWENFDSGTNKLTRGQWYTIDVTFQAGVACGEMNLKVDGETWINENCRNTGNTGIREIWIGEFWKSNSSDCIDLFIDDWMIDSSPLPPAVSGLTVNPSPINIITGDNGSASISGGTGSGTYVITNNSDPSVVATPSIDGINTLNVHGDATGTTVITVTDDNGAGDSFDVTVNVNPPLVASPDIVNLYVGVGQVVTVSGGSGSGYSAVSGNTDVATVSVSGNEVTVTGVAGGSVNVDISDSAGNHVVVAVYVDASITPGLGNCPTPPFTTAGIGPNVMMILDNTGSMQSGAGSKWENAKTALKDIVTANPNIRFGLMRLERRNNHRYGKILVPCGDAGNFATAAANIVDYIDTNFPENAWPNPESNTNLSQTLAAAGQYFATKIEDVGGTLRRVGKRDGDNQADPDNAANFGYYDPGYTYQGQDTNNYSPAGADPWYDAATTDDYGNSIDTTSPIQYSCEKSFIIFLTDGESLDDTGWSLIPDVIGDWDGDGEEDQADNCNVGAEKCDTDGSTYMDDVAGYLFSNDLRSDIPGTQNIITYTVGFAMGGQDETLLQHTAANGGGLYLSADNSVASLTNALQAQIADINSKMSAGTAVATITTSSQTDDYIYRAKFYPGSSWQGFLERYTLPYYDGKTADWEAGALLKARVTASGHGDRKIYTFLSSQTPKKQAFTAVDGAVKTTMRGLWASADTNAEAEDIIDYIRGDETYDGGKYRDRNGWLLGDIIYSTPTAVAAPKAWYFPGAQFSDHPEFGSYQSFKATHRSRKKMIYVGANDGMLHAFDAMSGNEDWAFIPEKIQANLEDLTLEDCHKYYVDLEPVIADIWDANDSSWKTQLIGGNRFGGEEYFALDVTDPAHDQFKAMWDVVPFPGHKSSTVPVVGKVQAENKSVDTWVAIVTSGYHSLSEEGRIAALDVTDGSGVDIWDDGDANGVLTQQKEDQISGTFYYSMTSPTAIDSDLDGYLDLIYAGDTEGSLWKFYYDYETQYWIKKELFNTGGQAITAPPALAFDGAGNLRIYFGTGKYLEESDKPNSTRNAIYCLIDKKQTTADANDGHYTGNSTILKANLADLTTTISKADLDLDVALKIAATTQGWFFELTDSSGLPAEMVLDRALVVSGTVFVSSFVPNQDVCGYGGSSKLYAIDYIYGVVDEVVLATMASGDRHIDLGAGIPSEPVFYFDPHHKVPSIFIQKSDSNLAIPPVQLQERPMQVQSWKNS